MEEAKNDTRPQQARGMNEVADIVQVRMRCGWQIISPENDNGVDGLIIDRKRGVDTGTLYFVQVKCGDGYRNDTKKRPNHFGVLLGEQDIVAHRPRWNRLQGPVILIYVDFKTKNAWWTDLKSDDSYCPQENKSLVLIPRNQRFGSHSLGPLRRLRNFAGLDKDYPVLSLTKADLVLGPYSTTLKHTARALYRGWATSPPAERENPRLGEVRVSRVDWRHISHRGRGADNVCQSWGLLGAAKRMILCNDVPVSIRRPKVVANTSTKTVYALVALRNRVVFPNRQEAVVQVVIQRRQSISTNTGLVETQNWFYSVHELRRGKKQH
jgi:hypothetical protein